MKWYVRIAIALLFVIFSPIIILCLCVGLIAYLFAVPKNKKEYTNSEYFKDFNLPYKSYLLCSPEYRFYNSIKKRNLPINYIRQASNGLGYFVFDDVLYLFPDFDQIAFNEDKSIWEADYDGDWKPFEEAYNNLVSKIDGQTDASCIRLLVERKMFPMTDLNGTDIPECIFLTWSYENAFENENSPLKLCVPTNAQELFAMMQQTADLCGDYRIADNGYILWDLYEAMQIVISVDPDDCCLEVNQKVSGKTVCGITHWHPTIFEIYDEVCKIGKRGNVLVIRTMLFGAGVLYMGNQQNCPYSPNKKARFGKYYYLKAN